MYLIETLTGRKLPIAIELLGDTRLNAISSKRFFFNWKKEKGNAVYSLKIKKREDILGLVSIEYFDIEYRIQIRLLAVSRENVGNQKMLEGIAGNLFAFFGRLAVKRYGALAAVSLKPKTVLRNHYINHYGFEEAGMHLFIEGENLYRLLKTYYYD